MAVDAVTVYERYLDGLGGGAARFEIASPL